MKFLNELENMKLKSINLDFLGQTDALLIVSGVKCVGDVDEK
jgi:hypothetical protein